MPTLGVYKDPKKRAAANRALLRAVVGAKKRKPKDPLAGVKKKYPGKWRVRKTNFNIFNYAVVCETQRIAYVFNHTLARAIAKLGGTK